jgi:hypothetical protein
MAKILITGNGFDLFHHLPTRYHHFISIMQTIEGNQYNADVSFDKLFGRVFKIKHQCEYDLIEENYNTAKIKFSYEKLNIIKGLLETNLWYKHFKNVTEIDTWIDFEIEVEYILNQLSIFNKYDDKSVVKRNFFKDELMHQTNLNHFNIVEFLANFKFKLKPKYINVRKGVVDLKEILEDLLVSFNDFILIFNQYLVDIVCTFYPYRKQIELIAFESIDKIYTFNYTPTFENIYNVDKSKIVYLHGEINENSQSQNLVLGVSELNSEVIKSKTHGFTKYYQKANKNTNPRFIDVPKDYEKGLSETIFYIIGHSLDESDKEYIIDLFDFLKFDNNRYSKICVFYISSKDKENKWNNLFNIIDKNLVTEMHKTERLYFVKLNIENVLSEFLKTTKSSGGWG